MPANNIHVLSDYDLQCFNEKYLFTFKDDVVLVSTKDYNRITAHALDSKFYLSTSKCKITITADAMKLWVANFKDNYTLVDVQNAINLFLITYQKPTVTDIASHLKMQKQKR